MDKWPELIVMLTHHDRTVKDSYQIFDQCKNSRAKFWGLKEEGLSLGQMKTLYRYMKDCGKTTVMEVVAYTEEECMAGAKMAVECDCDILMGTLFFDSINNYCQENQLRYMPFVGAVTQRPSILNGSVKEMIAEAHRYLEKGVYGIDLLAYRYTGDAKALIETFVRQVPAPVCLAGSIAGYDRLAEVKDSSSWAFTIGSGFFENKFVGSFGEQIDKVCAYMEN